MENVTTRKFLIIFGAKIQKRHFYLFSMIFREIIADVVFDLEERPDFENIYFQEDGAPCHRE